MNKSIKTEFDNLINSQTPDLWDRIEAALPEKNKVAFVGTERTAQAEGYGNVSPNYLSTNPSSRNHLSQKRKNKKWYPVYGTVGAAACVCVVIFALSGNHLLMEKNMTETADYTADYSENGVAEETDSAAMIYESTEGYEETNYEEAAMEEAEYEESNYGGVTESMSEESAEEEFTASDMADNVMAEESASETAVQSKIEELSKQGLTIHENVAVKVDCSFEGAVEDELISIYEVTLLKGTEFIEEGTTIQLKADPLLKEALKEGESYQITFYDNKPSYDSSNHEYFILKVKK